MTPRQAIKFLRLWFGPETHHTNCSSRFDKRSKCDCYNREKTKAYAAINVLEKLVKVSK